MQINNYAIINTDVDKNLIRLTVNIITENASLRNDKDKNTYISMNKCDKNVKICR